MTTAPAPNTNKGNNIVSSYTSSSSSSSSPAFYFPRSTLISLQDRINERLSLASNSSSLETGINNYNSDNSPSHPTHACVPPDPLPTTTGGEGEGEGVGWAALGGVLNGGHGIGTKDEDSTTILGGGGGKMKTIFDGMDFGGMGGSGPTGPASRNVSYYFPKGVGDYHFGEKHPMKPHRLTLTNSLVMGYGLHKKMTIYSPRPATLEEMGQFHSEEYLGFLKHITPDHLIPPPRKDRHDPAHTIPPYISSLLVRNDFRPTSHLDLANKLLAKFGCGDDCPVFDGMWEFCTQYSGASLAAARHLSPLSYPPPVNTPSGDRGSRSHRTDIAVNWTGGLHHAKKSEASGFCYVNDAVLAILELLRGYARVMYIDIDIHHGDGVQEAFYHTNRVYTLSFHKYAGDFFPGTGHINELGHRLGKHFSLNIPLQDGIDDESYVGLFKAIVEKAIEGYRPGCIVLQCGADSLGCDRLGCFNLSISAHGECVRYVKGFDVPLLIVGGGGYTMKNVARCWTYETAVLLDRQSDLSPTLPHTVYDKYFGDERPLHPKLEGGRAGGSGVGATNINTRKGLEKIRVAALERIKYLTGAPSVQMKEIPPGLGDWVQAEEEDWEREIKGLAPRRIELNSDEEMDDADDDMLIGGERQEQGGTDEQMNTDDDDGEGSPPPRARRSQPPSSLGLSKMTSNEKEKARSSDPPRKKDSEGETPSLFHLSHWAGDRDEDHPIGLPALPSPGGIQAMLAQASNPASPMPLLGAASLGEASRLAREMLKSGASPGTGLSAIPAGPSARAGKDRDRLGSVSMLAGSTSASGSASGSSVSQHGQLTSDQALPSTKRVTSTTVNKRRTTHISARSTVTSVTEDDRGEDEGDEEEKDELADMEGEEEAADTTMEDGTIPDRSHGDG